MKCAIAALALIAALTASASAASDDTSVPKTKVAVFRVKALGCDESTGAALEEMLAAKLYTYKQFTIMDREQMDRIAAREGFRDFDLTDTAQMARLGKILNVDKIVTGSVTKLDGYKIEIRAIDAKKGVVDRSVSREAKTEGSFETEIAEAAKHIDRYYLGYYTLSGSTDLTLAFMNAYPLGDIKEGYETGYGARITLLFNRPFGMPLDLITGCGAIYLTPGKEYIKYALYLPLELGLAYGFMLTRNVKAVPYLNGGYIFSMVSADSIELRASGVYQYENKWYYNPLVSVGCEFDIFLDDRWYLAVTPAYTVFFEPKHTGQFGSVALGLKMLFSKLVSIRFALMELLDAQSVDSKSLDERWLHVYSERQPYGSCTVSTVLLKWVSNITPRALPERCIEPRRNVIFDLILELI